jgi:hypothetical protein
MQNEIGTLETAIIEDEEKEPVLKAEQEAEHNKCCANLEVLRQRRDLSITLDSLSKCLVEAQDDLESYLNSSKTELDELQRQFLDRQRIVGALEEEYSSFEGKTGFLSTIYKTLLDSQLISARKEKHKFEQRIEATKAKQASQIEERRATINALRDSLKEKLTVLQERDPFFLDEELSCENLSRILEQTNRAYEGASGELASLRERFEARSKQRAQDLGHKRSRFKALRDALKVEQEKLRGAEAELRQKLQKLEQFERETLAPLEMSIADKETKISVINAEISAKAAEIQVLEAALTQKRDEISRFSAEISNARNAEGEANASLEQAQSVANAKKIALSRAEVGLDGVRGQRNLIEISERKLSDLANIFQASVEDGSNLYAELYKETRKAVRKAVGCRIALPIFETRRTFLDPNIVFEIRFPNIPNQERYKEKLVHIDEASGEVGLIDDVRSAGDSFRIFAESCISVQGKDVNQELELLWQKEAEQWVESKIACQGSRYQQLYQKFLTNPLERPKALKCIEGIESYLAKPIREPQAPERRAFWVANYQKMLEKKIELLSSFLQSLEGAPQADAQFEIKIEEQLQESRRRLAQIHKNASFGQPNGAQCENQANQFIAGVILDREGFEKALSEGDYYRYQVCLAVRRLDDLRNSLEPPTLTQVAKAINDRAWSKGGRKMLWEFLKATGAITYELYREGVKFEGQMESEVSAVFGSVEATQSGNSAGDGSTNVGSVVEGAAMAAV